MNALLALSAIVIALLLLIMERVSSPATGFFDAAKLDWPNTPDNAKQQTRATRTGCGLHDRPIRPVQQSPQGEACRLPGRWGCFLTTRLVHEPSGSSPPDRICVRVESGGDFCHNAPPATVRVGTQREAASRVAPNRRSATHRPRDHSANAFSDLPFFLTDA
jgi:hypothetical protein